jgi:hypothetical protein
VATKLVDIMAQANEFRNRILECGQLFVDDGSDISTLAARSKTLRFGKFVVAPSIPNTF